MAHQPVRTPTRVTMRCLLRPILTMAAALLMAPVVSAGQSAATLYALNCMGCHLPPEAAPSPALPPGAQFAHSAAGRVFFINLPVAGARAPTQQEEARLLAEILTWKRSCSVILQQAPLVRYRGARFVQ